MTIPAIIYQTSESLDVPPHLRRLQQSLRDHNPQFEFRLSDAAERTQHVLKHFPEWGDVYQALPFGVAKADIWRVMAVYSSGGFYADLDMEGFRSLERFRHYGLAIFSPLKLRSCRPGSASLAIHSLTSWQRACSQLRPGILFSRLSSTRCWRRFAGRPYVH